MIGRLSIVVIEDEELIKEGICSIIKAHADDWNIIGTASNGQEGLELISNLRPDVVLTDVKMPYIDGLELISIVRERDAEIAFVIITGYADFTYAQRALKHNVLEFILKPSSSEEILNVLERVKLLKEQQSRTKHIIENNPENMTFMTRIIINLIYNHVFAIDTSVEDRDETVDKILKQTNEIGFWSLNKDVIRKIIMDSYHGILERMLGDRIILNDNLLEAAKREFDAQPNEDWNELFLWVINNLYDLFLNSIDDSNLNIRNGIKYISENYNKGITLKDVADVVFLNYYYFSQLFKKETGMNFTEYLTSIRMNKAKELLRDVRYKTYEISNMVGYSSSKHFSTVFRKQFGLSPTEYRDSKRKGS